MQKWNLVVGLVMFMASTVSYSSYLPVPMTVVNAADESVTVEAAVETTAAVDDPAPFVADPTLMFASGVALFSLAAGVRRHIS